MILGLVSQQVDISALELDLLHPEDLSAPSCLRAPYVLLLLRPLMRVSLGHCEATVPSLCINLACQHCWKHTPTTLMSEIQWGDHLAATTYFIFCTAEAHLNIFSKLILLELALGYLFTLCLLMLVWLSSSFQSNFYIRPLELINPSVLIFSKPLCSYIYLYTFYTHTHTDTHIFFSWLIHDALSSLLPTCKDRNKSRGSL